MMLSQAGKVIPIYLDGTYCVRSHGGPSKGLQNGEVSS